MKKRLLLFIPFIFTVAVSSSFADLKLLTREIYSANGMSYNEITVTSGTIKKSCNVFIVNGDVAEPKKIIWLFHGYKPPGDPYRQSPKLFIENWNLISLCKKMGYVCIAPDMGTSMYPLATINDGTQISDMRYLKELYGELVFKNHRNVPVTLIGVSTGVEGAVKFSTMVDEIESIIALSGTYDLFSLPENSGEYRIHERALGKEQRVWMDENPKEILRRSVRMRIHLFCESNSIYREQAQALIDWRYTNLDINDKLDLGKGFSHNWNFWGSKKVAGAIREILLN